MKYLIKNICAFASKERIVFFLTVICIMCSSIIINFSYGFYKHLQQEKLDLIDDVDNFVIDFQDSTRDHVTKGKLLKVLCDVDDLAFNQCVIYFEIRFREDKTDNLAIDNTMLVANVQFCIDEGNIKLASLEKEWKEKNILIDGNYFSMEQFDKGELVCLKPKEYEYIYDEEIKWAQHYKANSNGKYLIHNKEYTSIGTQDLMGVIPVVPITTLDDECYVQRAIFSYPHSVLRTDFDLITTAIKNEFGDYAIIPDLSIQELDVKKFLIIMSLFCFVITIISGLVLALLFEYIIMKRNEKLAIFRLCGLSRNKAVMIYLLEGALIIIFTYVISTLVYRFLIFPILSDAFIYMRNAYTLWSYLKLGILYIVISLFFLLILIINNINNEIINTVRRI